MIFLISRCHGETDNVVFELARNKGLLESNGARYTNFQLIRSDGSIVHRHLSDKLSTLANQIVDENERDKSLFQGSLGNYFAEK